MLIYNLASSFSSVSAALLALFFAAQQYGIRAYNGGVKKLNHDIYFRDYLRFHALFNGSLNQWKQRSKTRSELSNWMVIRLLPTCFSTLSRV
jgi:hypothetical protein